MSEFSEAFAEAWEPALGVFGDECTIGGTTYPCIIHGFETTTEVQRGQAGRVRSANGSVILSSTDWTASGARKGTQVTIPGGTFRVLNDPEPGYTSNTIELQLGPLT